MVGLGASWETHFLKRELYFVFGEVDANVSGAFDEHHRVGGGVTGGVLTNLTEKWKALFSVGYLNYPLGDRSDDVRVFVGHRAIRFNKIWLSGPSSNLEMMTDKPSFSCKHIFDLSQRNGVPA